MAVAIARSSVVVLAAATAANQILGAFPGGLWVPALRFTINSDVAGAITICPVLIRTADAGVAAHLNGRPIIDRGEVQLNGHAALVVDVGGDALVNFELPVGLLPQSGPYWISVRGVSSNALGTARILVTAIGVPFEGATRSRRVGDAGGPLLAAGAPFGGAGRAGPPSGGRGG